MDFDAFFRQATGFSEPHSFQRAIAEHGFPEVIEVPTGAGKTEAAVLGWLYRLREHRDQAVRTTTPRRLVYALPMRTLVEQTERRVRGMIGRLGISDEIRVHVIMGGSLKAADLHQWRRAPHQPTIVIGTVDCVVSRALNRGYGATRSSYPIDFALVTNGAQLVIDEVQLAPQATATLRQIAGFQRHWGTAEPSGVTCMSATVDQTVLDVVDNPFDPATSATISLEIAALGDSDELRRRLEGTRLIEQLIGIVDSRSLAAAAVAAHQPGGLTIVFINTVKRAVEVYQAIKKSMPEAEPVLVHSRFRGCDRRELVDRILGPIPNHAGRIIVSTQVLEAGVDIDASVLVTEAAPWSSLIQRAGRCNRRGLASQSRLLWVPALSGHPYELADVAASEQALAALEGRSATVLDLLAQEVAQTRPELNIVRRSDLLNLFDTAPDLAGSDVDVTRFIRVDDQLDLQVAWVDTADFLGQAHRTAPMPPDGLRCSVSLSDIRSFLKREPRPLALAFDASADRWARLGPQQRVRPQELLLVDRASGGYDPELGFRAPSTTVVTVPEAVADLTPEASGLDDDPGATGARWLSLQRHLDDTREEARSLVSAVSECTDLDPATLAAVIAAAALHDLGKAHSGWQEALLATAPAIDLADDLYAKSPGQGRLVVRDSGGERRPGFRHELVSVLMLSGEAGEAAMKSEGVPEEAFELCRYLVGAHHGHLRLQPRDPLSEGRTGRTLLGLANGDQIPALPLGSGNVRGVNLSSFDGGPGSWTSSTLRLLAELGPFRLAYAEMLVRMADWRASAAIQLNAKEGS